jgi:hypothetical protein
VPAQWKERTRLGSLAVGGVTVAFAQSLGETDSIGQFRPEILVPDESLLFRRDASGYVQVIDLRY